MKSVISGAVVGLGLVLLIAGALPRRAEATRAAPARPSRRHAVPATAGLLAGAVVLLASGWPAAGAGSAVMVGLAVASVSARGDRPKAVEARLEALATWCEQLRDLLRAGAMLHQAIATTAATCPPVLCDPIVALVARLETGRADHALRRFADDLDDPTGDLVASVLLAASARAAGTAELLSELADLTRQRVERRTQIEAARAATRMDMRIILVVCAATVVGMALLARSEFLRPYRSAQGQLVLAVVFAVFVAAILWTRRIATYQRPARFLMVRSSAGDRP